jgi:hypothetical protein
MTLMTWIVARIRWFMLLSGALTCTMFAAAVAPSKAIFVALVLVYGRRYLAHAGVAVAFDVVTVAVFFAYLIGAKK